MNKAVYISITLILQACSSNISDVEDNQVCRTYPSQFMFLGSTHSCQWLSSSNTYSCMKDSGEVQEILFEGEGEFVKEFSVVGLFTRKSSITWINQDNMGNMAYTYRDDGALISIKSAGDGSLGYPAYSIDYSYSSHDDLNRPLTGFITNFPYRDCSELSIEITYDDMNRTYTTHTYGDNGCMDEYTKISVDENGSRISSWDSFSGEHQPTTILSTETLCIDG